jgi:hypothetical protein
MTVVGSCGHTFTEEEGMGIDATVTAMAYDMDGEYRAVHYESVCKKCYDLRKSENVLLTEEEEELWFDGKLDRPVWAWSKA